MENKNQLIDSLQKMFQKYGFAYLPKETEKIEEINFDIVCMKGNFKKLDHLINGFAYALPKITFTLFYVNEELTHTVYQLKVKKFD